MVRIPLSPEQVAAGVRLGALFREHRGDRELAAIAAEAEISPETLRKIEAGRMPSPGFGTVIGVCEALGLPIEDAVAAWRQMGAAHDRAAG